MIRLLAFLLALATAQAAGAQTLRIGLREDPDVLDPTLGSSYVGRIVYAAMCDKLFDIDAHLAIVPQLATGYEWTDPTHLVLHLRSGVTFQNGEQFDAEAVKYKLTRDLTIKGSMRAGEISAIQTIIVRDPMTVELVLKAPSAGLLAQLTDRAGIMIAPKAAEAAGDQFGLHPVCAGPFMLRQPGRAGPHRAEAVPGLLERRGDPFRPGDLHAAAQLARCGWRICRRARWTWWNTSHPRMCRPSAAIRS